MKSAISLAALLSLATVSMATIHVPDDYPTIQQAVDAAPVDGETILVGPGAYDEDVIVAGRSITIQATDGNQVTECRSFHWLSDPDYGGGELSGFTIWDGVVADNLRQDFTLAESVLQGPADLDMSEPSRFVQVSSCQFSARLDVHVASYYEFGSYASVHGCTFSGVPGGLYGSGYGVAVSNCIVRGSNGISVQTTEFGTVTGCALENGSINVSVSIFEGFANDNYLQSGSVSVIGFSRAEASENELLDGSISVYSSNPPAAAHNNTVTGGGIFANFGGISGNTISSADIAIDVDGGGVSNNTVHGCRIGLRSFDGGEIRNNDFFNCSEVGILDWSNTAGIESNLIVGCGAGIQIRSGSSTWISGNTIHQCGIGVDAPDEPGQIRGLERNLITLCETGVRCHPGADPGDFSCNDVWQSSMADWDGVPDQAGLNGNFSQDPRMCGEPDNVYTLATDSPCLPGNHPYGVNCGQIGARPEGCAIPSTVGTGGESIAVRGLQLHPNPATSAIDVRFELSHAGHIWISVFDAAGRRVHDLASAPYPAGRQALSWDRRDRFGRPVAAGIYYVVLKTNEEVHARRVTLLR